jgi:hypothetical protein
MNVEQEKINKQRTCVKYLNEEKKTQKPKPPTLNNFVGISQTYLCKKSYEPFVMFSE